MRKSSSFAVLVFFLALPASASDAARTRLAAVIVVDQMRPEYLDRSSLPDGGFKRLREGGARFLEARHLHLPTKTAPGHAAIATGRLPAVHGLVANAWYERSPAGETECVADASYGVGPEHLSGPSLPDALKAGDLRARVFAVSMKKDAAVPLGGRRPELVLWFEQDKGEFTTSAYYRRPSWLGAFNARLKRSGLYAPGAVSKLSMAAPATDEALDLLVAELVSRERVGRGPATDLLLISYSGTDIVGHRYGTQAPEMDRQLVALDGILGRLLRRLEAASAGSLVLALTADHGAIPTPEDPAGRALGVSRKDTAAFCAELVTAMGKEWPEQKPWLLSCLIPHVYLDRGLAEARGQSWPRFKRLAAAVLARVDGVGRALSDDDALALPAADVLAAALRRSLYPGRSGDVQVIMAENVLLHDQASGTNHGTLWDYDARVPLLFWGRGVKAGPLAGPAAVVDLAPTLGRLMGLDYPAGEGAMVRVEALAEPTAVSAPVPVPAASGNPRGAPAKSAAKLRSARTPLAPSPPGS